MFFMERVEERLKIQYRIHDSLINLQFIDHCISQLKEKIKQGEDDDEVRKYLKRMNKDVKDIKVQIIELQADLLKLIGDEDERTDN